LPRSCLVIPLICLLYFASLGGVIQNINVVGGVQGHENIIFSDDFESYPIGSFPSQGGWEIVWYGAGREYQKVIIAKEVLGFDEGHGRVLHLLGRRPCSSVVKRSFTTNSRYIGYEFDILILDRGEGYRDHPGFFCEECKKYGAYWATVEFSHNDGKIYARDGTVLGSWTPRRWYHVKVILDRENDRYDVYIDGRLRGRDLPAKKSDEPSSWRINSLALVSGWPGKPVLYDNVKVFTVEEEEEIEVDVYTNKGGRGANSPDGEYHVGETIRIYCSVNTAVDRLKLILYKLPSGEALVLYDGAWPGGTLQKSGIAGYPLGERAVACLVWKNGLRRNDVTVYNVVQAETKEDAEIIDFDPPRGAYSPGDTLSASVTIKNTGNVERSFWIGLSYRRPDGRYYDVPPKRTRTLSPNEEQRLIFRWNLPADAPTGRYDAISAVWNGYDPQKDEMIPPQFDRREIKNTFTVVSGPRVEVQLIQPRDGAVIRELPITFIVRVLVDGRPAGGVRVGLTCMDGGTSYCHPTDGKRFHYTDPDGYVRVQGFRTLGRGSCVRWYAEALYRGKTYRSATWRFCYQPALGDQYEPDNSMMQAKEIRSGESQRRSISPAGDVDWVKFTLTERSEVVIETSGPSGDTVIYLYDSNGNLIAEDDDSGDACWSRIKKTLDPGTYYIRVVEYGENDEIPEYHLKLSVTPKPAGAILKIGIRHSYIGDLRIWVGVEREGEKKEKLIWNREGGSRDNIFKEWDLFELGFTQDDLPPSENKRWYLKVRDEASGDEGRIEYFRIIYRGKVYESQDHPEIRDHQEAIAWMPSKPSPEWEVLILERIPAPDDTEVVYELKKQGPNKVGERQWFIFTIEIRDRGGEKPRDSGPFIRGGKCYICYERRKGPDIFIPSWLESTPNTVFSWYYTEYKRWGRVLIDEWKAAVEERGGREIAEQVAVNALFSSIGLLPLPKGYLSWVKGFALDIVNVLFTWLGIKLPPEYSDPNPPDHFVANILQNKNEYVCQELLIVTKPRYRKGIHFEGITGWATDFEMSFPEPGEHKIIIWFYIQMDRVLRPDAFVKPADVKVITLHIAS